MTRPSFSTFGEALSFLAQAAESGAFDVIADACDRFGEASADPELPSERDYLIDAAEELGRQHAMHDLRALYAHQEFPPDEEELWLGGHDKELGHLHLIFRAAPGERWRLADIFICR